MGLRVRTGRCVGRDKQGEDRSPRRVIGDFDGAARLSDIMFNKIQTNAVIATGFGGDAAFKNALADIGADADAAVGHFDNQLPGVELDQDFNRLMRQLGTLRGFDGVMQQVADDGDQLGFP